jgi:hypothetical protein
VTYPALQRFVVDSPPLPFREGRKIDPTRLPKMDIKFDIFLPHLPCGFLHVDVIDTIKESDDTAHGRVRMERFDRNGRPIFAKSAPTPNVTEACGPCYCTNSTCCNSCLDVRRTCRRKRRPLPALDSIEQCVRERYVETLKSIVNESCRVHGSMAVHLHPGTFHVAPGDSYDCAHDHVHPYEKLGVNVGLFNLTHTINQFSLGLPQRKGHFPLDGTQMVQSRRGRLKMFYFVRAVPIGTGAKQFSIGASSYQNYRGKTSTKFPGIFFSYDISPISVVQEQEVSIMQFLVEVSAILGGVFAISTFIDGIAFRLAPDEPKLPKPE